MAMHFLDATTSRGPEISLPLSRRGKFHLDRSHPTTYFMISPKTTFITTRLQNSVWQPQNMSLHILGINDDLRSKDLAGILFEITTDVIS